MNGPLPAIAPLPGGTRLSLHVVPRASRTSFAGLHGDGSLRIRLAAPPVDGKANRELLRFLAETLGIPVRSVELISGETGRAKSVRVTGLAPDEVRTRLDLA